MFLRLTDTWMNINRCDRGVMAIKLDLYEILSSQVTLIDTEVFRTDVEYLLFSFCEVQAVCIDWWRVVLCIA